MNELTIGKYYYDGARWWRKFDRGMVGVTVEIEDLLNDFLVFLESYKK
jgi:hypothetical protein